MARTLARPRRADVPACPRPRRRGRTIDRCCTASASRPSAATAASSRRSAIDAVGSGVFMPITMLYFLVATDLTLVQVGAAISLASLVALPDRSADRLGGRPGRRQAGAAGRQRRSRAPGSWPTWSPTRSSRSPRGRWWSPSAGPPSGAPTATSSPPSRCRGSGRSGSASSGRCATSASRSAGCSPASRSPIGTRRRYAAVVVANAASYAVAFVLLLAVPGHRARRAPSPSRARGRPCCATGPTGVLWCGQLAFSLSMMVLNFALPVYATTVARPARLGRAARSSRSTRSWSGSARGSWCAAMTGRIRWRILVAGQRCSSPRRTSCCSARPPPRSRSAWSWCWSGSAVYTLGELTGGPVTAALAAEAAPEHLRGRYFSLVQLAWNLAGTVAPVAFAWLLDRGATPLWLALLGLTAVGRRAVRRCWAGSCRWPPRR